MEKSSLILYAFFHRQKKNKNIIITEMISQWNGSIRHEAKMQDEICYCKNKKGQQISSVLSDYIRWELGCHLI